MPKNAKQGKESTKTTKSAGQILRERPTVIQVHHTACGEAKSEFLCTKSCACGAHGAVTFVFFVLWYNISSLLSPLAPSPAKHHTAGFQRSDDNPAAGFKNKHSIYIYVLMINKTTIISA